MTIMIPAWVSGTLQPVEKLEVHVKGLRHKAISVFVMNQGRILIQQRALGKYHTPGLWANTCCTHPDWEEDATDCAARRLDEELGIKGLTLQHRDQIEYRADVGDGLIEHEVVEMFVAEASDDVMVKLNPDEVMAVRWITYNNLLVEVAAKPEAFTPWLQIYLSEHANRIFGGVPKAC